jgi:hypothetical protein
MDEVIFLYIAEEAKAHNMAVLFLSPTIFSELIIVTLITTIITPLVPMVGSIPTT